MFPWSFPVFINYKNSIVPLFPQSCCSLGHVPSPPTQTLNNQWDNRLEQNGIKLNNATVLTLFASIEDAFHLRGVSKSFLTEYSGVFCWTCKSATLGTDH